MEIRDYLRVIRRQLLIIIAIPVIAAVGAVLLLGGGKQQWTSKVEVAVPTLSQNTAAGAVTVFVANFQEYLTTEPVIDLLVKQNPGIKRNTLKNGLSASEVGASDLITVTYEGTDKNVVQSVALSATNATLNLSASPQVADAQADQRLAQQAYSQARATLDAFVNSPSGGLPEDRYRDALSNLDSIKLAASQARLDLNVPKANGLDAQIPQAEAALSALLPQVETYQRLDDAQAQASAALSNATDRVQQALGQNSAHSATPLRSEAPKKVSKIKKDISVGLIGAAVGLIIALLFVIFSEVHRTSRARKDRESVDVGSDGVVSGGPNNVNGAPGSVVGPGGAVVANK